MPLVKSTGAQSGLWSVLNDEGLFDKIQDELPSLPTAAEAEESGWGTSYVDAARRDWGADVLEREQTFAQNVIAGTAGSVGFPKGAMFNSARSLFFDVEGKFERGGRRLKNAYAVVGKWDDIGLSEAAFSENGKLSKTVVEAFGPALQGIGYVSNLAGQIVPIVGAVVKTLSFIVNLIKGNKKDDPAESFVRLTRFNREFDVHFANQWILKVLRTGPTSARDWTSVWSPPGTGGFFGRKIKDDNDNDWGTRFAAKGVMSDTEEAYSPYNDDFWAGGIPLSANIDLGWEISKNGRWDSGTRSRGALLPTGKDQLPRMWAIALKPETGASFCIDTAKIRDRWMQYLYTFRMVLQIAADNEGTTVLGGLSREAATQFVNGIAREYYGWGPYDTSLTSAQAQKGTMNQMASAFGLNKSTLMQSILQMEKVQQSSVNTIACAYADETYVAVKSGQPLHSKWKQNRMDLLQHSAICRVDLDNIPDIAYRQAAQAAQVGRGCVGGSMMLAAGSSFKPNAPKPPPPAPRLNGLITASRVGGGGGGGAFLIAAAMLGLLVMKNKR